MTLGLKDKTRLVCWDLSFITPTMDKTRLDSEELSFITPTMDKTRLISEELSFITPAIDKTLRSMDIKSIRLKFVQNFITNM